MGIVVWQEDEKEELVFKYLNETQNIFELAEYFGVSHRSIISILTRLKVYRKPIKKGAVTTKHILFDLEKYLDIQFDISKTGVPNMNKKSNLALVVDALREKLNHPDNREQGDTLNINE